MNAEDDVSHRERKRREAERDQAADEARIDEEKEAANLTDEEEVDVEERRAAPAKIIHEVIRRQGIEELERPVMSLLWSALAAGVVMGLSVLGEALLSAAVPEGRSHELFVSFGYTFGFLIVIMGRLQLFTESTVTAIIPLATKPNMHNLGRTARLWSVVFGANMVGTFAFALFANSGGFADPEIADRMIEVSRSIFADSPRQVFLTGIPAGFLIATLVWMMPSASGQRIWIIILITWLIALGGFAHVVAGSGEAWLLLLAGEISLAQALFGFLLPALGGNVVGGSALFAVLAHAQVRQEIHR